MWKKIKKYFEIISQEEIDCAIQGACDNISGVIWHDISNLPEYLIISDNINKVKPKGLFT